MFGEEPILRFTRVICASLIRIADAAVALFRVNMQAPIVQQDRGELALARANAEAALLFLPEAFRGPFRQHARVAVQRSRVASGESEVFDAVDLTVGFVDLVDSTGMAEQLSPTELGRALGEFEARAWTDVVTAHGGVALSLVSAPGTVVADAAVRDAANDALVFAPLGARDLRGLDDAVELFAVGRS